MSINSLPETGYYEEWQILGDPDASPPVPAIIPVSREAWRSGVAKGRYPMPLRYNLDRPLWRAQDIRELRERLSEEGSWELL